MKNLVVLKQVDKLTGQYNEFRYKPFDSLEDKASVLKSLLSFLDKAFNSECIIQVENFKEHEIQEMNIF